MIIKRTYGIKKYTYTTDAAVGIKGTAKNTHNVLQHSILAEDGRNTFSAKQTNFILKLLGSIPLINLVLFAPFKCYLNDIYCGRVTKKCCKPVLVFETEKDVYELILQTGDIIKLTKNGKQIVSYKKEPYSQNEGHTYDAVQTDDSVPCVFILAFCMIADAVFYPSSGYASNKYEKTIVFGKN